MRERKSNWLFEIMIVEDSQTCPIPSATDGFLKRGGRDIYSLGLFPVSGKSYPIGLVAWLRITRFSRMSKSQVKQCVIIAYVLYAIEAVYLIWVLTLGIL